MGVTLDAPWAGETFAPPTAIDIATIETAIVERLRAGLGIIEVAQFPDKPSAYRLTHRIGAALVAWRGATYGPIADTAAVVQTRRLEFEITLILRGLGWGFATDPSGQSPGAYALLESVRSSLTGFQIAGLGKMHPIREQFLGRDPQGGAWTWSTLYGLEAIAMEVSTQNGFPLFVKGTALEQGGQTTAVASEGAYTFDAQDVIQLAAGNIINATVTPSVGGNAYVAGVDYIMDAVNGIITRLSNGAIAADATVNVSYVYAETVTAVAGGGADPTVPTN